jgi:hypothetical protein
VSVCHLKHFGVLAHTRELKKRELKNEINKKEKKNHVNDDDSITTDT